MILLSHAKINLGLHILEKRSDGYHNLRSVMYPTGLCDILEIREMPLEEAPFRLSLTGIPTESDPEENLVTRAWKLFNEASPLPPLAVHLHKQIPVGAGLGGGSSNASTVLKALNKIARQPCIPKQLENMAASLGSDCPFFLHSGPRLIEGRGEILSRFDLDLNGCFLVLLFPDIHISTAEAYAGVIPGMPEVPLEKILSRPPSEWKGVLSNDFEKQVELRYLVIGEMKKALYQAGALYASLSGSGSSMYGIFRKDPHLSGELRQYVIWKGPA